MSNFRVSVLFRQQKSQDGYPISSTQLYSDVFIRARSISLVHSCYSEIRTKSTIVGYSSSFTETFSSLNRKLNDTVMSLTGTRR